MEEHFHESFYPFPVDKGRLTTKGSAALGRTGNGPKFPGNKNRCA
jgi:hypothetical protein